MESEELLKPLKEATFTDLCISFPLACSNELHGVYMETKLDYGFFPSIIKRAKNIFEQRSSYNEFENAKIFTNKFKVF